MKFSLVDLRAAFRLPIRTRAPLHIHHSVPSAGTFRAGRNAEKRAARAEDAKNRASMIKLCDDVHAMDVALCARLGGAPKPIVHIPKRHASTKMIDMLANRRLRQIGAR